MKTQLGVIFGSRSCEREVAIISAVQLMNHVDPEKYDVIPVYIDERGLWYTGEALRSVQTYLAFDPAKSKLRQVSLDMAAGSGALVAFEPGKGLFGKAQQVLVARLDVVVIVMHGLHGEDGTIEVGGFTVTVTGGKAAVSGTAEPVHGVSLSDVAATQSGGVWTVSYKYALQR